jgi:hypothetical protein
VWYLRGDGPRGNHPNKGILFACQLLECHAPDGSLIPRDLDVLLPLQFAYNIAVAEWEAADEGHSLRSFDYVEVMDKVHAPRLCISREFRRLAPSISPTNINAG